MAFFKWKFILFFLIVLHNTNFQCSLERSYRGGFHEYLQTNNLYFDHKEERYYVSSCKPHFSLYKMGNKCYPSHEHVCKVIEGHVILLIFKITFQINKQSAAFSFWYSQTTFESMLRKILPHSTKAHSFKSTPVVIVFINIISPRLDKILDC